MASELAPVTPSVLQWARESLGVSLEDAAKRAGVGVERVAAWEAGEAEPTVAKLRALAKLYQRPLSVFFLPEPPVGFDVMRDFRRLPGQEDHTWSRALHRVYRRAVEQQEIAIDLLEEEGERPKVSLPSVDLPPDGDMAEAAERAGTVARRALGVTIEEQVSWRKPEEAFAGWLGGVEDLGVFVLRTSDVSLSEMRGFSLTGTIPVIVVNALDYPRGQVFTLAHEFMHLLLREGGLCDLLEPGSGLTRRVEAFCNSAAAAMLLPRDILLDNEVLAPSGIREWEPEVLSQLSVRYGVSQEAVLRRLVTLRRASMDYYLAMREQFAAAYSEQREMERARRREATGGPPPHRMAIRDRGKPYIRLVLDAYYRDAISSSSLSSFLGLKLKHLPAVEREVRA